MNSKILCKCIPLFLIASVFAAHQADGATLRYRLGGNWNTVTDGTSEGWGLNPNNNGSPGSGLPGAADDARINWGGSTVEVTTSVPTVSRVQIGVNESGTVRVRNGGVLTADLDILAGNNDANATGTLIVEDGGEVNVGRILWAAQTNSDGVIDVQSGGLVNVASHLWWGVTGTATIDISGTVNQTGGILGLGTNNAVSPTNGTATVTIRDGGLLALNNISGAPGQPSIQPGSLINIEGTGELTVPGDLVGNVQGYVDAGLIAGDGVPGPTNLTVDLTTTHRGADCRASSRGRRSFRRRKTASTRYGSTPRNEEHDESLQKSKTRAS